MKNINIHRYMGTRINHTIQYNMYLQTLSEKHFLAYKQENSEIQSVIPTNLD